MVQSIAYLLPTNADRINFALCSSDLAAKILPAESHIWRGLFRDTFDEIVKRSVVDYKIEYQIRTIVLARAVDFKYGQQEKQTYWLELLRDMIQESLYQDKITESDEVPKNFNCLREALYNTEFLSRPVSGYMMRKPDPPSDLFCAVQLVILLSKTEEILCRDDNGNN